MEDLYMVGELPQGLPMIQTPDRAGQFQSSSLSGFWLRCTSVELKLLRRNLRRCNSHSSQMGQVTKTEVGWTRLLARRTPL